MPFSKSKHDGSKLSSVRRQSIGRYWERKREGKARKEVLEIMVDPPRGCDSSTGSGTAAPRGSLVWWVPTVQSTCGSIHCMYRLNLSSVFWVGIFFFFPLSFPTESNSRERRISQVRYCSAVQRSRCSEWFRHSTLIGKVGTTTKHVRVIPP